MSVTFVQPTHRVELFGNILDRLIAQAPEQFVLKFWKKFQGLLFSCKLNGRGIKIVVFRPISRLISKTVQGTAIVTMEDNRNSYAIY